MAASGYAPNYSLTPAMLGLVDEISGLAGPIDAGGGLEAHPRLRRAGRIRSIHSSLAIESSALSLDQVAGVVEGRKVSGRPEEIREAKNAAKAYSALDGLDPFSHARQRIRAQLQPDPGHARPGR
jgi:Fic family protein